MSSYNWPSCPRRRFVNFWRFFEYEGFLGLGFLYTILVSILIHIRKFSLGERLSFSLLAFSGEFPPFLSSFSFLRFSVSLLWVYSGQSGFLESVGEVVFRRGV